MLRYGIPAHQHSYGLWYDMRRADHRTQCRINDHVKAPFYEMPWARSGQGIACDGLSKYDLTRFNDWYFERLHEFARLSEEKGIVFNHNYYNQHALLEQQPHYVDFPWRPVNNIQDTGMPDMIPAANTFYDTSHATRRELHRLYIRRVLDEIGKYRNTFHFPSLEYTGNSEFVRFWMETILEWESESPGRDVRIGIAAPKNVLDAILADADLARHIDAIDLSYFWYKKDGTQSTKRGGLNAPGRIFDGDLLSIESSPQQVYRQTLEYRLRYPKKAIFHSTGLDTQFMLGFIMAGGSINFAHIHYNGIGRNRPANYILPQDVRHLQRLFSFFNSHVTSSLSSMSPASNITGNREDTFTLASDQRILVYALHDGPIELDMSDFPGDYTGYWFNPGANSNSPILFRKSLAGVISLTPPSRDDWILLLERR
jgi:hypothetical protein